LEQFAEKIGISRNYYDCLEKGVKGKRLTLATASKLASVLNVTLDDLHSLEKTFLKENHHD